MNNFFPNSKYTLNRIILQIRVRWYKDSSNFKNLSHKILEKYFPQCAHVGSVNLKSSAGNCLCTIAISSPKLNELQNIKQWDNSINN